MCPSPYVNYLSTNVRDRNINITFKNSYKSTIINIKANVLLMTWTCYSIVSFIVNTSISILSFIIATFIYRYVMK